MARRSRKFASKEEFLKHVDDIFDIPSLKEASIKLMMKKHGIESESDLPWNRPFELTDDDLARAAAAVTASMNKTQTKRLDEAHKESGDQFRRSHLKKYFDKWLDKERFVVVGGCDENGKPNTILQNIQQILQDDFDHHDLEKISALEDHKMPQRVKQTTVAEWLETGIIELMMDCGLIKENDYPGDRPLKPLTDNDRLTLAAETASINKTQTGSLDSLEEAHEEPGDQLRRSHFKKYFDESLKEETCVVVGGCDGNGTPNPIHEDILQIFQDGFNYHDFGMIFALINYIESHAVDPPTIKDCEAGTVAPTATEDSQTGPVQTTTGDSETDPVEQTTTEDSETCTVAPTTTEDSETGPIAPTTTEDSETGPVAPTTTEDSGTDTVAPTATPDSEAGTVATTMNVKTRKPFNSFRFSVEERFLQFKERIKLELQTCDAYQKLIEQRLKVERKKLKGLPPSEKAAKAKAKGIQEIFDGSTFYAEHCAPPYTFLPKCPESIISDTAEGSMLLTEKLDFIKTLQSSPNFFVITALGQTQSGKSSLLSFLAKEYGDKVSAPIFTARPDYEFNHSYMYMLSDCTILIELTSVFNMHSTYDWLNRDAPPRANVDNAMLSSNLRLVRWALSISHLVVVMSESFVDPNLFQLISSAQQARPMQSVHGEYAHAEIIYVFNKAPLAWSFNEKTIKNLEEIFKSVTRREPRISPCTYMIQNYSWDLFQTPEHKKLHDNVSLFNRRCRPVCSELPLPNPFPYFPMEITLEDWWTAAYKLWEELRPTFFLHYVRAANRQ